jgi:hypothetical protein
VAPSPAIEPREREARVFLMTSSLARQLPLATVIIAMVPRFAVEVASWRLFNRLSVVGLANRAWSMVTLDRSIVLLIQDFVVTDEPTTTRLLRRKIDLISALVLLRATLLTRITGDAGIVRQRAAIVPLGRIGTEELGTACLSAIAIFARESRVPPNRPPSLRKVVADGGKMSRRCFETIAGPCGRSVTKHVCIAGRAGQVAC